MSERSRPPLIWALRVPGQATRYIAADLWDLQERGPIVEATIMLEPPGGPYTPLKTKLVGMFNLAIPGTVLELATKDELAEGAGDGY